MPNSFAYFMLLVWPFVALLFFRRLSVNQAIIWTILGGYLALPPLTSFDLPILPSLDKVTIPNICAYLGFLATKTQPWFWPKSIVARLTLALFVLTPIGTVLTNADFIPFGIGGLPSMALQEAPSLVLSNLVTMLPVLVGYQVFRDDKAIRDVLSALVLAGLIYSIPMLVEIRFSPQLNILIYGFFQHEFNQMIRYGGYRPIVFLPHGLWVAFLAFMAALSAFTLLALGSQNRTRNFLIFIYLLAMLIACKSAGVLIYIIVFPPLVLMLSGKMQVRLAAMIGAITLFYPVLRGGGFIPTQAIADFTASIDADRAGSFIYRLMNEDLLLEHASARPLFGWGGWARNLVHDSITGRALTVVDGEWVNSIGMYGWAGYVGEFGLLGLPLFMLALRSRYKNVIISKYAGALVLIFTANLIDLIPNATLIPFTWLLAGTLLGYTERLRLSPVEQNSSKPLKATAPWARLQLET